MQRPPQQLHQHPRGRHRAHLHPKAKASQPSRAQHQSAQSAKDHNPRHPERTLLYRTVVKHFETWFDLARAAPFDGQGDHHTPAPYVEKAFRQDLECSIFARGFARARCDDCRHDYLVAFSCKGRGVCPGCNTRHMAGIASVMKVTTAGMRQRWPSLRCVSSTAWTPVTGPAPPIRATHRRCAPPPIFQREPP